MRFWFLFLFVLMLAAGSASSQSPAKLPFQVVKPNAVGQFTVNERSDLLYAARNFQVIRDAEAKDSDFKEMYLVKLNPIFPEQLDLSPYGELLHFDESGFAIMNLKDDAQVMSLSGKLHENGYGCGLLFKMNGDTVSSNNLTVNLFAPPQINLTTKLADVETALATVSPQNIETEVNNLAAIETRIHTSATGQMVASMLVDKYRAIAGNKPGITIETVTHTNTNQPSLRVRITGQKAPNEVVILGSHIDSVSNTSTRSPGADDNASGTSTNLELFRVIMQSGFTFDRTVEIHGYAAEEIGLVGSQEIALDYRNRNVNVITMMQFDMNLYRNNNQDRIWFVSNGTDATLTQQLRDLAALYIPEVPTDTAVLTAGSSDHEAWQRQGFTVVFPTENPNDFNQMIHTANDTVANSGGFTQAAAFAKLGIAYLAHFAGLTQTDQGSENCTCKLDDQQKFCTLYDDNDTAISWTVLPEGASCDQSACQEHFSLSLKVNCSAGGS